MRNSYEKAKHSFETFPFFFFVSLLFCVLLQFGPGKLRTQAASAILGMFNPSALILLFTACTTVTGATLLVCGALTPESSTKKVNVIRLFVERPAALMVNLVVPMLAATFALGISCLVFGYSSKVWGLLGVLISLIVFALFAFGLVASTRSHLLAKLDQTMAGGRAFGFIIVLVSVGVFYWVSLR